MYTTLKKQNKCLKVSIDLIEWFTTM